MYEIRVKRCNWGIALFLTLNSLYIGFDIYCPIYKKINFINIFANKKYECYNGLKFAANINIFYTSSTKLLVPNQYIKWLISYIKPKDLRSLLDKELDMNRIDEILPDEEIKEQIYI